MTTNLFDRLSLDQLRERVRLNALRGVASSADLLAEIEARIERQGAAPFPAVGEMFSIPDFGGERAIVASANRSDYDENMGQVVVLFDAVAGRYVVALRKSDSDDDATVVASFVYARDQKRAYTRALDAMRREALR